MPLSRLENFLKNIQGNVLYVNPEELDATDDISNTGNSRTRPFKTIQRALLESARFSYQLGKDNDKFDKTTIVVAPGIHYIDNRPGYQINTAGAVTDINGSNQAINEFSIGTEFDVQNANNVLYQFNSIHGGVILPRGTSIVGMDLRKTKVRPKFVPDPANSNIYSSAIFRVTGGCYFREVTIFDGDPADRIYKDYTTSVYQPNYSHHKLTAFEFADGKNIVTGKGITDLDMYYAKLTLAFGNSSGRAIPSYPSNSDFEKVTDESRIVGELSQIGAIEIEDIYSGVNPSSSTATTVVSVVTAEPHDYNVGTPVIIKGVAGSGNVNGTEYDGVHIVTQVLSDTLFTYSVTSAPASTATPNLSGLSPTATIESDTVASSSPYIFNCSVRSVFGMNGLWADGAKASGFKSMVAAQFTGVSLNKDDTAFVKYDSASGTYKDQTALGDSSTLHTDAFAIHKPSHESFHIKASNDAVLQLVSTFAVGCGKHFICESGGDSSITNSNSNFGEKALGADGFKFDAFNKDDKGFITGIVPAQKNYTNEINFNWLKIDVEDTVGASSNKLYIRGYKNKDTVPTDKTSIYTVGNKVDETLSLTIAGITSTANVLMTVPTGVGPSGKKEHFVGRTSGINSITSNVLTLQADHNLFQGESVQFYSDTGSLPDGIEHKKVYYAITASLNPNQIKIASTKNNALANNAITGLNNLGGNITVISDVATKLPGDPGHPLQWDETGWHLNVNSGNELHTFITQNQSNITPETTNTFIKRKVDNRRDIERIYRAQYIIPEGATNASPPQNGYVIQDSGTVIDDEKFQNDNVNLNNDLDLRTDTNIIHASWSSNVGIVTTKFPHRLKRGQTIQVNRVRSTNNTSGTANLGYNGIFEVLSINDKKTFSIGIGTNPGGMSTITTGIPYTLHNNNIVGSGRTFSPYFVRKEYGNAYQIFNHEVVQEHVQGSQDGIYNLTLLSYNNIPEVSPFDIGANRFPQNVNDLKPVVSLDNPVDDPEPTKSYALRGTIGQVEGSDPAHSITKETSLNIIEDTGVGIGLTASSVSGSDASIFTEVDHGFNSILSVGNITGGTQYGTNSGSAEFYFSVDLVGGTGKGATADVTVAAAATITAVDLVDHGTGYSVGDVLTVKGVPFITPGADCQVTVSAIDNNVGDVIQIVGVGSDSYNGLHRISAVTDPNKVTYSQSNISVGSTGGYMYHVGVATAVNNIVHDTISGIATVTLHKDIGLRRGDQIVLSGITGSAAVYNGTYPIQDRIGYGSSLSVLIDAGSSPSYTSGGIGHGNGIGLKGKNRAISIYGGTTTNLTSGLTTTTTSLSVYNHDKLRRGDYLQIENEIVRITSNATTSIARGALGTNATSHPRFAAAVKIKVLPVEARRHSTIRASGHTFEYIGFGPGNYSTSLPQTQTRVLNDDEQLLAQATTSRGGTIVYSGMNDKGEFYVGRKKIDAITGEEKSTITEFDSSSASALPSTLTLDELSVNSNFYSLGNTEVVDIELKGNRSGNVGNSVIVGVNGSNQTAPTSSVDKIIINTTFDAGGYLGWVRTSDPTQPWKKFGLISYDHTDSYAVDRMGIGIAQNTSGRVFDVTGDSSFAGNIVASGVGTFSTGLVAGSAKISDLTETRVTFAGANGELQDSSSLVFSGATLTANTLVVQQNATVTQTLQAEQITSTDDINAADDITAGGTVTASDFVGNGTIPIGGIIMWSGTDANIPTNWALCNGSNGTPNLVDRFIVGRGSSYADNATGGSADAVVVSHQHSTTETGHKHNYAFAAPQDNSISDNYQSSGTTNTTNHGILNELEQSGGPDGDRLNGFTADTESVSTGLSIDNQGVSGTNANLPPYYAIAYIMRIS